MKNNSKTIYFSILLISLALLSLSFVSAAAMTVTYVSPAASATLTGATSKVNVTAANAIVNYTCAVYLYSASTANSSIAKGLMADFGVQNNSDVAWNTTINTLSVEDSNDYTMLVNCTNGTNYATATRTSLTVQNSVPTAPASLSPATNTQITTGGSQTFTSTVVDKNTTGCTYIISRGGATATSGDPNDYTAGTATYSGSTCSFTKTFTSFYENGDWTWTITATDGTDTTASTSTVLNVKMPAGGGVVISNNNHQVVTAVTTTTKSFFSNISDFFTNLINKIKALFTR